ncbi:MAG: hypothetical protein H6718_21660 [Polyangiaceae bacterium]|nr:hypothetical protein [Myxococcales bacterium]MCB9588028.1 hypothetical protein [Polyangiaceae bacterium]
MGVRMLSALALLGACGCTSWTTVHAGYAEVAGDRKPLYAVETRRVVGGKIDSTSAVGGFRVDGNGEQLDVELHAGVERALFLSERWMLIPSFTVDAVRVSRLESRWFVGTHSPALGLEWLYWFEVQRRRRSDTGVLGCMGGAIGYDCPRCEVEDVNRRGFGLRIEGSYDLRYSDAFPKYNDWSLWALIGFSEAESTREKDSCAPKN